MSTERTPSKHIGFKYKAEDKNSRKIIKKVPIHLISSVWASVSIIIFDSNEI